MSPRIVGVVDIGKSNAKFAVVDLESRSELAVRKMPNAVLRDGPYPHYDVPALWDFLRGSIADLNREHPLDALSVTTHGASAALIDSEGALTLPVLDYEFAGPDELAAEYDKARPDFSESFTPRLPAGLNLGAQLFWQARRYPDAFARTKWILPYPQYWSYRLCGVAASEITSLGCHTDLWNFETDLYSSLVLGEGWLEKMPQVRPAADVLGLVLPELAARLGLRPHLPVHCGIHDSNASLLPHLLERQPPFSVVSTGTWVIVCTPGGDLSRLDPERDCLANLDALGRTVPSARFMGGREFSQLVGDDPVVPHEAALARVLEDNVLLLPSVTEGSGPFPRRKAHWNKPAHTIDRETNFVGVSFYLAMMTAECLSLTGAEGDVVVEGPFAANRFYLRMLASASTQRVVAMTGSATGTSIGAALLARMEAAGTGPRAAFHHFAGTPEMAAYARRWRALVGQG
ncbi:MAG: FGGY-family carbohydrate kinase [Devosia sp.]|nr:FGGY-family carbohydrate kinase [Devosia sp.]